MWNGLRHSGQGAPPAAAAAPCMGAAWNHVTTHRAHARCMQRVMVGARAGAQHMQHCGVVLPSAISSINANPPCFTEACSATKRVRESYAKSVDAPAAASARAYGASAPISSAKSADRARARSSASYRASSAACADKANAWLFLFFFASFFRASLGITSSSSAAPPPETPAVVPESNRTPPGVSSRRRARASRAAATASRYVSCTCSGARAMARRGLPSGSAGSRSCAAARAASAAASAEATSPSSRAARNARRRKRTLRRPELSFDEDVDDVARLAEAFASASRPAAFGTRAAHPIRSASRAFAAARKRSNAAPEVMSSTARSHLSFGRGARAAATASRAAASAAEATCVASSARAARLFARASSVNAAALAQQGGGETSPGAFISDAFPLACRSNARHPHVHPAHAHSFARRPGNACCSLCSLARAASRRAAASASRAATPGTRSARAAASASPRRWRSAAFRRILRRPSATSASLCARSAPPASAYSRLVPRHACRSASNERMSALRSANAEAARPPAEGADRRAAVGPEALASRGAMSSSSASPAGSARTRRTSSAAAASTADASSCPAASRKLSEAPFANLPTCPSRGAPDVLAWRIASSTSRRRARTSVAEVVAPRTMRSRRVASALAERVRAPEPAPPRADAARSFSRTRNAPRAATEAWCSRNEHTKRSDGASCAAAPWRTARSSRAADGSVNNGDPSATRRCALVCRTTTPRSNARRSGRHSASRFANGTPILCAQNPSVWSDKQNGHTPRKSSSPFKSSTPPCSGVPDTIHRNSDSRSRHAAASCVVLLRTIWHSSSTTRRHLIRDKTRDSLAATPDDSRSAAPPLFLRRAFDASRCSCGYVHNTTSASASSATRRSSRCFAESFSPFTSFVACVRFWPRLP